VAPAMNYVATKGLVHRDLKRENILVMNEGMGPAWTAASLRPRSLAVGAGSSSTARPGV
jgi:serine/threonine protein kinase